MAGELRAKLVAENRKVFGPKGVDPAEFSGHAAGAAGHAAGAGGHGPLHEALAKEAVAGKVLDKTLEPHAHKLAKTGKYLTRAGTSTMAKSLMADETGKELGKALAKSGAQKVAGKVLTQVGSKALPVIGQIDLASTGLTLTNKAIDKNIADKQKAWDEAMNGDWEGNKHDLMVNWGGRPKDSPLKGKELPTFAGKAMEGVGHLWNKDFNVGKMAHQTVPPFKKGKSK